MNDFKLDHISYAVRSTDASIQALCIIYPNVLSYKILEKSQGVFVTYLTSQNIDYKIELVEGAKRPNPVENLVKSGYAVPYHVCYRAKNLQESAEYLKSRGFFAITKPFKTYAHKGFWACHFFHRDCGVIEIMSKSRARGKK